MSAAHQQTFDAIVTGMASNVIQQMAAILDGEGIEIEPMEVKINGAEIGSMSINDLAGHLRRISNDFRNCSVSTTVEKLS